MTRLFRLLAFVTSVAMGLPAMAGLIRAGDRIGLIQMEVSAKEKAKVDGRDVAGESGSIRIPLAGVAVAAAGLNREHLARMPGIVSRGARVIVGGQVRKPGPVRFVEGMTVLKALQAAGDLTPFGTRRRVVLTRRDQSYQLDLRSAKWRNYRLQPGDTIMVPQKPTFDR